MPNSEPARFTDARLKVEPAETFVRTVNRPFLESELPRFYEFCQVDKAHTVMLAEQGIISRDDASKILRGLAKWEELGPDQAPIDPSRSSYLFQVEAFLAQEIGEDTAGRMHTARGRADYGSTSLSLHMRNRLLRVMGHIVRFQRVLLQVASQHIETLMPGYTHLQQSQPQTFGHYILSHFYPLERDFWRLEGAYRRINLNPLGCLARAGTSWPIDRRRTTELLGFDDIVMNAQDQTCYRREHTAEVAAVLSLVLSNLGRLVTDLDQWFAEEFGFIDFSDAYAGSSSITPHKKNPYPFERCRALAGEAIGWFPSILGVIKLPHTSAADPTFSPSYDGIAQFGVDYCCDMLQLIAEVLETFTMKERKVQDVNGNWRRLAEYDRRQLSNVALMNVSQDPQRVEFQLIYQGYFSGPATVRQPDTYRSDRFLLRPTGWPGDSRDRECVVRARSAPRRFRHRQRDFARDCAVRLDEVCIEAEATCTWRTSEIRTPKRSSATETVLPPGALMTAMPSSVARSRSMLSTPTPARPITRRRVPRSRSSAVMRVALRPTSAS
jgi:argininosuccinate lyase